MKTENTTENKQAFFGQYWGQYIVMAGIVKVEHLHDICEDDYLNLTPLSKISDEDAIEVANLIGYVNAKAEFDCVCNGFWIDFCHGTSRKFIDMVLLNFQCADYLRYKGYALPFRDLSVEDMIEYGWIKLKK